MRILFLVHMFFPENRAGVETYTWQVARALAERGHEVRVLTARKIISLTTGATRNRSLDGLEITDAVNTLVFDDYAESYASAPMEEAFERVLDSWRPEVIHVQHLMHWSVRLPEIARRRGIPVLTTLHDYWFVCGRMGQLIDADGAMCEGPSPHRCAPCLSQTFYRQPPEAARWIERLTSIRRFTGLALDGPLRAAQALRHRGKSAPKSSDDGLPLEDLDLWKNRFEARRSAFAAALEAFDLVLSPSRKLAELHEEWGMPAGLIRHFPHGIDHAPFLNIERKPRGEGGPLRLGFAATIAPHKGLHVLLEAFLRLPAGAATLEIHGPYQQHRGYHADLLAKYGEVPGLSFGEPLDRSGLREFFGRVDLLCVPSLWNECAPLTILEAQVAGIPCAVSNIGGMAELVRHEETGLALAPGDFQAWAAGIGRLAKETAALDEMRAKLEAPLTLEKHLDALEEIFQGLVP
jgi:glycosyltransferase involved in cell wall biosynthesis